MPSLLAPHRMPYQVLHLAHCQEMAAIALRQAPALCRSLDFLRCQNWGPAKDKRLLQGCQQMERQEMGPSRSRLVRRRGRMRQTSLDQLRSYHTRRCLHCGHRMY